MLVEILQKLVATIDACEHFIGDSFVLTRSNERAAIGINQSCHHSVNVTDRRQHCDGEDFVEHAPLLHSAVDGLHHPSHLGDLARFAWPLSMGTELDTDENELLSHLLMPSKLLFIMESRIEDSLFLPLARYVTTTETI